MIGIRLSPLVRRVTASNTSPLTGPGTNTYLVGDGEVTVIDPGPADPGHVAAVHAALGEARLGRILLTHAHPDHAPGAGLLARETGAAVLAHPLDLRDGEVLTRGGASLEVLHTPGHASDHVCFLLKEERALFSGDMIKSGSTVVIAPPDGDMAVYMRSLQRLRGRRLRRIYPGHGDVIEDGPAAIREYLRHRRMRERQILEGLGAGPARVAELVARIYTDLPPALRPLAAQSVYAHLLKLRAEGRASGMDHDSEWRLS